MILERLGLLWQRWQTRRKMERVFGRKEDPFDYETSLYEVARLKAMDEAAGPGPFASVLEAGCAEGHFTERLAARAASLTAVDLSAKAIARARARLRAKAVDFVEADVRDFKPPSGVQYDLVVLGDVLYYLDKPMARAAFDSLFARIVSWLAPGGRVLLAHGYAGAQELAHRRGFRERFERAGLRLVSERSLDGGASARGVACLISVLEAAR